MKFYTYEADAAGSYGENTVFQGQQRPREVRRLHYEFHLWPEEDLQCWISCYVGTDRLRKALEALIPSVTGIEFDEVEISGDDDEFAKVERKGRTDSELGQWYWFKITGKAEVDDFGFAGPAHDLVISERIKALLIDRKMVINPARKIQEWSAESART